MPRDTSKPFMQALRSSIRSSLIFLLGKESRPRRILGGLARGYRIQASPAEQLSYLLGTNEPHLQRAIREYVTTGDTVYDIGANIGYVSLSFSKRVGPRGRVFAFEPIPQNVESFKRNMALSRVGNVHLLEAAVAERAGTVVFRMAENPSTASMVWHRDNQAAVEFSVNTVSIDELVRKGELATPKFVKIDVEGAEGFVLLGMRHTVQTSRPVVFIECSEAGRSQTWPLLRELNYRCQSAITGRPVREFEDYRHSDFLWLPN